jgi:hypothetical protein
MKTNCLLITAIVLSIASQPVKLQGCLISITTAQPETYGPLFNGLVLGLYQYPQDSCSYCDSIGNLMGNTQSAFIFMENNRNLWTDPNSINSLGLNDKFNRLKTLFDIFYNFSTEINYLLSDSKMQLIGKKLVARFDSSFADTIKNNLIDNIVSLYMLTGSAPGSNCKSLGVRLGASIRKVFSISFD